MFSLFSEDLKQNRQSGVEGSQTLLLVLEGTVGFLDNYIQCDSPTCSGMKLVRHSRECGKVPLRM